MAKNGRWAYRFANAQLNLHGPGVKPEPLAKIPVPPGGSDLCFEWTGPISQAVEHLKMHDVKIELGPVQAVRGAGRRYLNLLSGPGWVAFGVYLLHRYRQSAI